MMSLTLEAQVQILLEKVDRILSLLEARPSAARQHKVRARMHKEKSPPLTPDEIARHQDHFEKLYSIWDAGEELQVEKELAAMDADEVRRFADANNLSITSKTSKQKVMQLIAGRFRERRQLMRSHSNRRASNQ
jgi:hypothetical protein